MVNARKTTKERRVATDWKISDRFGVWKGRIQTYCALGNFNAKSLGHYQIPLQNIKNYIPIFYPTSPIFNYLGKLMRPSRGEQILLPAIACIFSPVLFLIHVNRTILEAKISVKFRGRPIKKNPEQV